MSKDTEELKFEFQGEYHPRLTLWTPFLANDIRDFKPQNIDIPLWLYEKWVKEEKK